MSRRLLKISTEGDWLSAARGRVIVLTHCEYQNNLVQEQPYLVPSFDEAVDFAVRHGLLPFRFEHLNLAFEGSKQPLFAAKLLVSFQCHAVKDQRAG